MRVEQFKADRGRVVLAHMVMSTPVLSRVASRWEPPGLFAGTWENLVASWCLDYFAQHGKAPRKGIRSLYEDWAASSQDKETPQLVERFLSYLSDDYAANGKLPTGHVVDMAGSHFNRVKLERLKEEIEANLDANKLSKANKAVQSFAKVEIGEDSFVDPFHDEAAVTQAFSQEAYEPLLLFNNPLDRFFVHMLSRKSFVALQAPEKAGKSYLLAEMAYLALLQRRNVAFFAIGDLTEEEMIRRLAERVAGHPSSSDTGKWPYKVRVPKSIERPAKDSEDKLPVVKYDTLTFNGPLGAKQANEAFRRVAQKKLKSDRSLFRMCCHPADTLSVLGIRDKLREWEGQGYNADVVCIAEGSLVLTDSGLKPIESVADHDRLWDGLSWVTHGGKVYKGEKTVIEYGGLTATPDHLIWSEGRWRTIESCRRLGLPATQTGLGRQEVRLSEGRVADGTGSSLQDQRGQGGQVSIRSSEMHFMQSQEMVLTQESPWGDSEGVSCLFSTKTIPDISLPQTPSCKIQMRERKQSIMEGLWWQGNQIQVCFCNRCLFVGSALFGTSKSWARVRSCRERWALRAGQYSLVYAPPELFSLTQESGRTSGPSFSATTSRNQLQRQLFGPSFGKRYDSGGGSGSLEINTTSVRRAKVWDIVNAGPFHRFTVQGLLVHNCIDYADILAPMPGFYKDERESTNKTWRRLKALAQERHCLVLTATQADSGSYDRRSQTRKNFSTDKRKYAETDGVCAINVTEAEREIGSMRLAWLAKRRGRYSMRRECYVAGNLAIASPATVAVF